MPDSRDTEKLLKKIEAEYGAEKKDQLTGYLDRILERNEHINLTAVRDRDEAMQKHIADSLSCTELDEYKRASKVVDIGTGAGFPGVPLAIVSPEKEFVLIDSLRKRLRIIDEFTEDLGIGNVTTLHARAEEASAKDEYRQAFDVCVSRAVANLTTLGKWCLPFVKKGGYFISYKGENYEQELSEAKETIRKLGGKTARVVVCDDADESISGHVLIVIEKIR